MKKAPITFKSLVFDLHPLDKNKHKIIENLKASGASDKEIETTENLYGVEDNLLATKTFKNAFGVSVLKGTRFYSNGIDTYEVAVLRDGEVCYDSGVTGDVIGYITEAEVNAIMIEVQELEEGYVLPPEE